MNSKVNVLTLDQAYATALRHLEKDAAAEAVTVNFIAKTTGLSKALTVHRSGDMDITDAATV